MASTPWQTLGPFFSLGLLRPGDADLTRGGRAAGEPIEIAGRVLQEGRAPVARALVEVWQADAGGRYPHPADARREPAPDPHFRGFGRALTDADGAYRFRTVRPGPVPGPGNSLQAPHVLVSVCAAGLLRRAVTRLYFADEPHNAHDPVLVAVDDPALRETLLAAPDGTARWRFDIVLRGDGETAFFTD